MMKKAARRINEAVPVSRISGSSAGSGVTAGEYQGFADIKSTEPIEAVRHLGPPSIKPEQKVDVEIGGPPYTQ